MTKAARPTARRIAPVLHTLVALVSCVAAGASGQIPPVPVEEIRLDPQAHLNEIRTVEGVVDRLVNREGASSPSFYLEDDYGHQILVIPFEAPPARGDRLSVTGVVTLDPSGDPVLTLFDAAAALGRSPPETSGSRGDSSITGVPPLAQAPRVGGPFTTRFGSMMLPAAAAVFVILLAGFFYHRGRAAAAAPNPLVTVPLARHQDVDFATSALWPASDQRFDGRTLRFLRPDATVRLMPARLEVIGGGDAGEEIRFVSVVKDGEEKTEMVFGRSEGEGAAYVQLKQKTVSRTHAIIRHRHGEWLLENLSMTNPTVLNGEVLGVKERLLTDTDRIEMGEVVFRFRES